MELPPQLEEDMQPRTPGLGGSLRARALLEGMVLSGQLVIAPLPDRLVMASMELLNNTVEEEVLDSGNSSQDTDETTYQRIRNERKKKIYYKRC
jgi:hypothetical protein